MTPNTSRSAGVRPRVLVVVLASLALVISFAGAVSATPGESTPGVTVIAVNSGGPRAQSDVQISLTAHSERGTVDSPSCRPQDLTLRCWGSLHLQVPDMDGMTVTRFEVHRVAIGDASCDHDDDGGCDHDDDGGCDHDDDGGCGGHDDGGHDAMATELARLLADYPIDAQVNGVAVLTDPGNTDLPAGTKVQVKITLTDNGRARHGDEIDVQVNEFVPGPVKPLIYQSGPQTVEQVQVRLLGA